MTLQVKNIPQKANQNLTKNGRQFYSMMKPKNMLNIPILTFSFNNKEDLRSIITDYALHHMQEERKSVPSKKFKSKYVKYPIITLKVNINKEEKEINLQFVTFLSKYLEFQKKNIYRQDRIQPLVVDILNFLDQIEQKTKGIIFEIQNTSNAKKVEEEVMTLIIQKYHKDKQKNCYRIDLDQYKKKTIAKHTRVSYIDIEDQLKKKQKQFLLQIIEVDNLIANKLNKKQEVVLIPKVISQSSEKLNNLIQSGQMFDNPSKILELKKQKMMEFYKSNQVQYLGFKDLIVKQYSEMGDNFDIDMNRGKKNAFSDQGGKQNMNNFDENSKSSNKSSENLVKVLKDWIIDIGISEKYYQKKFGKMDKKKINHLDAEQQLFIQQNQI